MSAKKNPIKSTLKMKIRAGQASAAPPIGSTLGQYGVNMMDFINPFNEETKDRMGEEITVHIFIHEDKSMTWRVVGTPTDVLILKELGESKGSGKPNSEKLGKKLTDAQVTKIAELKMTDTNTDRLDSIKKMVAGTARSMGIEIA